MLKINYSTDLSSKTYQDALSIRKEVFIKEQNVEPDIEIDGVEGWVNPQWGLSKSEGK